MALVSAADLRAWIGRALDSDEFSDSELSDLEEAVVSWLETATLRPLTFASRAEIIDGPGGYGALFLPYELVDDSGATGYSAPVLEVRDGLTDAWTTVSSSNYEIHYDRKARTSVVLRTDGLAWPLGAGLVRMTMPGGWNESEAGDASPPKDLVRAVKKVAALDYASRIRPISIRSKDDGDGELQVPEDVIVTARAYRNYYSRRKISRRLKR